MAGKASKRARGVLARTQTTYRRAGSVKTRLGRLKRLGTNPWGKALVACPQCGSPATATATGEIWCRQCGFTTAQLAGCG